jgi:deoxyxylulose-5-phosphate synthase
MHIEAGPLLKMIDSPEDLKNISREKLHQVCDELRQYIIDVVSVHGGHFAASLGVVELSVATEPVLFFSVATAQPVAISHSNHRLGCGK